MRIHYKRTKALEAPPEVRLIRPKGLKTFIILLIIIDLPVLASGILFLLMAFLATFLLGLLGLIVFILGSLLVITGTLIGIQAIGVWRMNYTAWKGESILLGILAVIFFIPVLNFFLFSLIFTIFLSFLYIPFGWELFHSIQIFLPYLIGLCFAGLLGYLIKIRDQFVKPDEKPVPREEKLPPGKCPVCQTQNDPSVQVCSFCGYKFSQKGG